MDIWHVYSSADLARVSLYAPPGMEPPETIEVGGVRFMRVSDRSLECGEVLDAKGKSSGRCTTSGCHALELGSCKCGRHPGVVRFERASR